MKPKVGDRIHITEKWLGEDLPSVDDWEVIAVFDHYDFDKPGGDWSIFGELAWAQKDIDEENHKKGEWYVIVTHKDDPSSMSLASYECELMEAEDVD